ncbi:hypothetical protein [Sphingobacterium sp. MYb388]|uniref:hypothetical protein n=1 Tax=Sphingobacterium sp. MYb388 TaxID=2745437 RepID=UPI0030B19987
MNSQFTLPNFPDSTFEIEVLFWTGKQILYKDEVLVERSVEIGKPFLIPDSNGKIVKAYPKSAFPDIIPVLEINDVKYSIVERLPWYQMAFALLPFLLAFIGGGALGAVLAGVIGAVASLLNIVILRNDQFGKIKYLYVINVTLIAYASYFFYEAMIKEWIS